MMDTRTVICNYRETLLLKRTLSICQYLSILLNVSHSCTCTDLSRMILVYCGKLIL